MGKKRLNMEKRILRRGEKQIPAISNYPSRKEWENAVWKMIVRSPEALIMLTTPNERHDLVMRAAVTDRIRVGKSYREISKELWSSLQTIRSIKKSLSESKYRSYRERGKTERKKKVYSKSSRGASWHEPRRRLSPEIGSIQLSGITRTRYPESG